MSRDRECLLDILQAARLALTYVSGKTEAAFVGDTQCQDAVIRRLEIIGEAARRLSEQTRGSLPTLPWNLMVGMRNLMIHEYDDVDLGVVWHTVQDDLPGLVVAIQSLVPPDESQNGSSS